MLALEVTTVQTALAVAVVAAATALVGARAEFHRSQRVRAYSDFAGALVAVVNAGTSLGSAAMQLGADAIRRDDTVRPLWERWSPAHESYQQAKALLNLVASERARIAAAVAYEFFVDNVLKAPPFVSDEELKDAGPVARHGPGPVSREVSNQVAAFVTVARRDVVGRRWRSGAMTGSADGSEGRRSGARGGPADTAEMPARSEPDR